MTRHRVRDLLGETGHLVDLDARRELELVTGDGGTDGSADEARVDTELTQRRFERRQVVGGGFEVVSAVTACNADRHA